MSASAETLPVRPLEPRGRRVWLDGAGNGVARATAHARFMRRALALAARALGATAPNPPVGALIVKRGRVIGEGYHRRAGAPHAEIEALRAAGIGARGATLYVTLEPCNHTGRTPPCCEAILAAGVAAVVVGTQDPNPVMDGRALARLRRARVRVTTGVLEAEARALIRPFAKAMRLGLPFVLAKIAQSLDGKIATRDGDSRWISSPRARRLAHEWRSQADAILVGIRTVLRDDPRLTVRGVGVQRQPLKVIMDSRLRTPPTARCLRSGPTLIATTAQAARRRRTQFPRGVQVCALPARQGRVPLRSLCRALVVRGIHSVLLEGGGELIASALEEQLVDRVAVIIAPILIGGQDAPGAVGGAGIVRLGDAARLRDLTIRRLGPDLCVEADVEYRNHPARRASA